VFVKILKKNQKFGISKRNSKNSNKIKKTKFSKDQK
jgi:hypothetical protein